VLGDFKGMNTREKAAVFVVAGASGAIGSEIVRALAREEGARIYAGYSSNQAAINELVELVQPAGASSCEIVPWQVDLASTSGIHSALETLAARESAITAFIHAAGIHRAGPLAALSDEDVLSQIQVNLTSAILLCRKISEIMMRRRSGSIVLIGSVSAHRMIRGHAVYSATKAALEGFAKALAAELAKRSVRVNCILPGPVLSPMLREAMDLTGDDPKARIPMGRLIEAREVAEATVFLASERASAITGQCLAVDGGYLLW
jgi:3-oxoacyl-[acyl-carrier protein] reductase